MSFGFSHVTPKGKKEARLLEYEALPTIVLVLVVVLDIPSGWEM
jgi:hypothetical protein